MATPCEHLAPLTALDFSPPTPPDACPICLVEGLQWVSLRQCQACGQVGCCDSSPGRHATAHHQATNHPVMRSIMPGDTWDWCFVHQETGSLG